METVNKLVLPAAILIASIILGGFYYASVVARQASAERGQQAKNTQVANFDLQTKCANAANRFFSNDGSIKDSTFRNTYEDNYNSRLGQCFILIRSDSLKDVGGDRGFLAIDLYDALTGKHYAMFSGHSDCSTATLVLEGNLKKCQLDGGVIWYSGDDITTPDYRIGFQGFANGSARGD